MKRFAVVLGLALCAAGGSAQADWAVCAREGEICRFNGKHEISFGAGKQWNTRVFTDGVACTTEKFGDPAPGQKKSCQIRLAGTASSAGTIDGSWAQCAIEGRVCQFNGRRKVAYGANGKVLYRMAEGSIACSNERFGGDPAPGTPKRCWVSPT